MQPYSSNQNAYESLFEETYLPSQEFERLDLAMPDDLLRKMFVMSLDQDVDYWNQKPWDLQNTDIEAMKLLLGDRMNDVEFYIDMNDEIDNALFSSVRAILSYATGQLAVPDLTPSRGDDIYIKGARDTASALYQHSLDEHVDMKVRGAVLNLIARKRGALKLRFDPNAGINGDIVTENVDPADIIIDRYARYMENPAKIYQRLRCSVDELCARFPNKANDIKAALGIKQARFSQMSRFVTYFECWFTYYDKNVPREGVCWFLPEAQIILDKMPNPNWIYTGDDKKDREVNLLSCPPKPFAWFNYMNFGNSFIDETSLLEQGKPLQNLINRRQKQISDNADFVNGRWLASSKTFNQEDAQKLINKGARTVALVDSEDVTKSMMNVASSELPAYVANSLLYAYQRLDVVMGTPSVFKGTQPETSDTLGRDLLVKEQAGMLQDDLVRAVSAGMEQYYAVKLQMMKVFYDEDHWFQTKGADGKYQFITLTGDDIDPDIKIGVQVDSTLPLDKASVRSTAMALWNAGQAIDYKTLMEDLGLPNPDIRAERYMTSLTDPIRYAKGIEVSQMNDEAEADIALLLRGKTPDERDEYDEAYIAYYTKFLTTNRFAKVVQENPEGAQAVVAFLMAVQQAVVQSANLQGLIANDADMIDAPAAMPPEEAAEGEPVENDQSAGVI